MEPWPRGVVVAASGLAARVVQRGANVRNRLHHVCGEDRTHKCAKFTLQTAVLAVLKPPVFTAAAVVRAGFLLTFATNGTGRVCQPVQSIAVDGERVAALVTQAQRTAVGFGAQTIALSGSAGVAHFGAGAEAPNQRLARADAAMDAAKRGGRGQVHGL